MSRADAAGEYPIHFESWPREAQAKRVADDHYRASLIRRCLLLAGVDAPDDLGNDDRLRKEWLAAMYCELKGIDHEQTEGQQ